MAKNQKFFKLGKAARSFTDPKTGLTIANDEVVAIDETRLVDAGLVSASLQSGHIVEATEAEYNDYTKSATKRKEAILSGKTVEEIPVREPELVEEEDEDDAEDDDDENDDDDEETAPPVKKPQPAEKPRKKTAGKK